MSLPPPIPEGGPDVRETPCGACGEPALREGHFYVCRNRACRCWMQYAPEPAPKP